MVSACLLDIKSAFSNRVMIDLTRELHHVRAMVNCCCTTTAFEGFRKHSSSSTADLDEVIVARECKFLKNYAKVGIVVKRVAIDITRPCTGWTARPSVSQPVSEAFRRRRLQERRNDCPREPACQFARFA